MKPPEDVIKKIEALAKQKDIRIDVLNARLEEIINTDEDCRSIIDDDARFRVACGILMCEHTTSKTQKEKYREHVSNAFEETHIIYDNMMEKHNSELNKMLATEVFKDLLRLER